ncbi:hypothetical protein [Kitasatospora sp. NPDC059327]|uniref:hypothetical protein n=1 Tax=Kitasatospora sp. NPDC059327 TaxID=3346803 RepID=UPI00369F2495
MTIVVPPYPAPGPVPARPKNPTTGEVIIVVVILALAAALMALGQPMVGAIEVAGGLVFLAGRTIKALRDPDPNPAQGL